MIEHDAPLDSRVNPGEHGIEPGGGVRAPDALWMWEIAAPQRGLRQHRRRAQQLHADFVGLEGEGDVAPEEFAGQTTQLHGTARLLDVSKTRVVFATDRHL